MPRLFPLRLLCTAFLLGLLTVSCAIPKAIPKAMGPLGRDKHSELAVRQAQLLGNWSMQMEQMMDVSQLSAAEQEHLSAMMGEMQVILTFTEDGKLLSSADSSAVPYEVKDNQLLLAGNPISFTVSDTQLTLEGNGEALTFTRTDQDISQVASNPFAATPVTSDVPPTPQSEVKQSTGAINRAQQVHYLDNAGFASDVSELGLGLEAAVDTYRYSIRNTEAASFTHAIAQQNNLKSAVGAVFIVPQSQSFMGTQTIVCVADTPGAARLREPSIQDNTLTCAKGSSKG